MAHCQRSSTPEFQLIPEHCWKLDPLFSSCCNLFIGDILSIPSYPGGTQDNVFIYKNHPIRWVSIMGIVVKAEERAKFFHYGVDDGTGVISCICWKATDEEESLLESSMIKSTESLCDRMERFNLEQQTCLEVGSLVHIRGKLKLYKEARQISAFSCGRLSDPTHSLEIRAMTEQVEKYRRVYDVPFINNELREDLNEGNLKSMKQIAKEVSEQVLMVSRRDGFQDFHIHELETVTDIYRVCCQPCQEFTSTEPDQLPPLRQISQVLKEAVSCLLDKGYAFKSRQGRGLMHITLANKALTKDTLRILSTECKKVEHVNGCNFLHLFDLLRKRDAYMFITHAALRKVLNSLEERGAIVSCDQNSYIPVR